MSADKSNTGVDDTIERIGEMALAVAGTAFCIYGGLTAALDGQWAVIGLALSFGLYQSTSITKYIEHIT